MSDRVLLVDDEQNLLDGLRRSLGSRYAITTASSGAEGLVSLQAAVAEKKPFAVIVSDMRMPVMNGAQFLAKAVKVNPNAVMMILSGEADLTSTVSAVNNANLFRFLTKPCAPEDLTQALDSALRQYQLLTSEKDLLERTLGGAVAVLTDVLTMASPAASRRTERVRKIMGTVIEKLRLAEDWRLPLAAMLSHVGCIAVPAQVLDDLDSGKTLSDAEQEMFQAHPRIGRQLLERIPRLEEVAEWVGSQPTSVSDKAGEVSTETGGQVFSCIAAFLVQMDAKVAPRDIARRLTVASRYPAPVIDAVLAAVERLAPGGVARDITSRQLTTDMVIDCDIKTSTGMVLVRKGERVTDVLAARLQNFSRSVGIVEPFRVLVVETPAG